MAIRQIITAPDPRLKRKAAAVGRVDAEISRLMDDMLDTMYDADGIGLAAPQIGVSKRVVVIDLSRDDETPHPLKMADPEVIFASEEKTAREEGCLSLPQQYAEVSRPSRVMVRYIDQTNQTREIEAEGLLAVCIQHELDHLDGTLFVDRISALKRGIILRKLQKAKRENGGRDLSHEGHEAF